MGAEFFFGGRGTNFPNISEPEVYSTSGSDVIRG